MMRHFRIAAGPLLLSCAAAISCVPGALAQDREKRIAPVSPESRNEFQGGRNVAIVVGIDEYSGDPELSPLQYAGKDAKLISTALKEHKYEVKLIAGRDATREGILKEIAGIGRI